jgi:HD-like signal output (HDOD) protein
MMIAGAVLAVLLALGGWFALRPRTAPNRSSGRSPPSRAGAGPVTGAPVPVADKFSSDPIDTLRVQAANELAAGRLWKLAFGLVAPAQEVRAEHARVRDLVLRALRAPTLDPKYFPRRPTLMPQLLSVVNDPDAGPGALAAIIAQDPVLAGDALRLANSSFYKISAEPVETIQRAIVICGIDGLQSLIATALMQPVFRATGTNFPRFPALLWERTARASRAAELYASKARRQDRFEAQMVALLNALGPLVVYRATLEAFARYPDQTPSAELCVALIESFGQETSQRIAKDWQSSPRLIAALDPASADSDPGIDQSLAHALYCGELLATLSLLAAENALTTRDATRLALDAGLSEELALGIWERLAASN